MDFNDRPQQIRFMLRLIRQRYPYACLKCLTEGCSVCSGKDPLNINLQTAESVSPTLRVEGKGSDPKDWESRSDFISRLIKDGYLQRIR
jgi:hypothetical protein